MKCRDVRRKLVEYAEASLPLGDKAEVESHLETCAGCRAEMAALDRAETALRALAVVETAPELTADLHHRLASRPPVRRFTWVWAGAGVIAIAAAILFLQWPHSKAPMPRPRSHPARIAARLPSSLPAPPAVSPLAAKPAEPASKPKLRHRAHRGRGVPFAHPAPMVAEAPQPQPEAVAEGPAQAPIGIILLIGVPQESAPVSSYHVEISFPDGATSMREQVVERDAHDRPRAVRIARDYTAPGAPSPGQGG
jgi:hypothetical protein